MGGLSTVAACAPSDQFLKWAGPLGIGLGGVFVASIGSMFVPATTTLGLSLYSISLYGGLVLFSAFLLYDTQKVGDVLGLPALRHTEGGSCSGPSCSTTSVVGHLFGLPALRHTEDGSCSRPFCSTTQVRWIIYVTRQRCSFLLQYVIPTW